MANILICADGYFRGFSPVSLEPCVQVHTGFSWRICDIMASNAMLLSNPTNDLTQLFGGIVPTCTDAKDLHDKCEYFIKHENKRHDTVKNVMKKIKGVGK